MLLTEPIMHNIQVQNVDKIKNIRCLHSAMGTYTGHTAHLIFVRNGEI